MAQRAGRLASPLSWTLAVLAALAVATGSLLTYADHTLFRSAAFSDRVAASLKIAPVRAAVAGKLAGAAISVAPDLTAVRGVVEVAAGGIVASAPFRSLVRRAALDVHRSAFDRHRREVAVRVRDAGLLLADALRRVSPRLADRVPVRIAVRIVRIKDGVDGFMLRLAERADRARRARTIAFLAALLLAAATLAITRPRRTGVLRLGLALAAVSGIVALAAALAPRVLASNHDRAVGAVLGEWLDPVIVWAIAGCAAGLLVVVAAASIVRAFPVARLLRRTRWTLAAPPRNPLDRGARVAAALLLGGAMVARPRGVLTAVVVALGVAIALAAVAEILAAVAGPAPAARERPGGSRGRRIGAATIAMTAAIGTVAALASGGAPTPTRTGRCNGHASLCDRPVDQVAFLATHNSMAADREPGWLFPAQDAGIGAQLQAGVRGLLIDTHYGARTGRGVVTDLSGDAPTRAKLVAQVGEPVVAAATRIRRRIGSRPTGRRQVFLCHTFCEVGATSAVAALRVVHRFLVRHPEEVVVLVIQDATSPADTAAAIRASGLIDEVYLGAARRPWPTLRELIDRDQRVIVIAENQAGDVPWMHLQPAVMQETPFHFTTVQALEAPTTCRPNRGGTAGSLLLVNHWVDTSPAPRVTIARRVNRRDVLEHRVAHCRATRHMLPNLVAVDFYRQGDALRVVDDLNGVR